MLVGGLEKGTGQGKYKVYVDSVTGPASYPAGGFNIAIDALSKVDGAVVIASRGYLASVHSIIGKTITVKVYQFDYAAASAGPAVDVPAGTDLSNVTFYVIAVGE